MNLECLNSLSYDYFLTHSNKSSPVNLSLVLWFLVDEPTMTSADFSDPISSPLDDDTPRLRGVSEISPGNALIPSHLYLPHIQLYLPGKYRTFEIYASLSDITASYMVSVRQASVLPSASFRFHLTVDTLAVR
jgi:hypothetical protein